MKRDVFRGVKEAAVDAIAQVLSAHTPKNSGGATQTDISRGDIKHRSRTASKLGTR